MPSALVSDKHVNRCDWPYSYVLWVSDELIRQITINCAERGLLLLRVRDEARMTITAYETLYESSIAYGVRKALVAEQKKIDLVSKIKGTIVLLLFVYSNIF